MKLSLRINYLCNCFSEEIASKDILENIYNKYNVNKINLFTLEFIGVFDGKYLYTALISFD